jgi:hypothetical protein
VYQKERIDNYYKERIKKQQRDPSSIKNIPDDEKAFLDIEKR